MVQRIFLITCILFLSVSVNAQLQEPSIEETDVTYLVEVYTSHAAGSHDLNDNVCMEGMYYTPLGFLADDDEYTEYNVCHGSTCCSCDDYRRYYCSFRHFEHYLTTEIISNITFSFETTCRDAMCNIDHDLMDQDFSFRFNSYGVDFLKYDINSWESGGYDYKAVGLVAVHPLYLLSVNKKFNKVGSNLPIHMQRKVFTYSTAVPSNVEDILLDAGGECSYSSQYDIYLEVKLASEGEDSWRRVNYSVYDPQDYNYNVRYSAIESAFGSTDFIGKECKIRLHQGLTKQWTTKDISFYYLPALEIDNLDIDNVSCSDTDDGHLDITIGGFNSPPSSPFQYLYLLYKYSREDTCISDLSQIRSEDRVECLYENGHCTQIYFEYPFTSAGGQSLTTSFDVNNLPEGIYKLKAYTVYSTDTTHYYPADTVFEIKAPNPVSFNTDFEYDWSGFHIPTGQNSADVTLRTSGGWGNQYRYSLDGSGWSNLYTSNVTLSLQQAANHEVCVKDANNCLAQPNCRFFAFKAPEPIVFNAPTVNIPSCNKLNAGDTADGNATFNVTGGLLPFRVENVIAGDEQLETAVNTINQCFIQFESLPIVIRNSSLAKSITEYYYSGNIIGKESEIITVTEDALDNCGMVCNFYPEIETMGENLISALEDLRDNFSLEQDREFFFDDLPSGTYRLSVIDRTSREIFDTTYILNEPGLLEIDSVAFTGVPCWNSLSDAQVHVTGTPIDTFYCRRVSNNQLLKNTSGTFGNLYPEEEYTFYYTDNKKCISLEHSGTVSSAPPEITVTSSTTDAACIKAANGQALVSASGGTPHNGDSYKFERINPNQFDNTWYISKKFIGLNANSIYTIKITDDSGCTDTVTVNIGALADTLHIVSASPSDALCDELRGSIEVDIDGGERPTGSYTYTLLNNELTTLRTVNDISQTTYTFSGYSPGSYYIEINDTTNCSDRLPVKIGTHTDQILLSPDSCTSENTVCEGVSTGSVVARAMKGFPTGTQYHYFLEQTDGDERRNAATSGQVTFDLLPEGTYRLIVADDSSCYDTVNNIQINVEGQPVSYSMFDIQNQYCDEHRASFNVSASSSSAAINLIELRYPNNITETISTTETAYKGGLLADAGNYRITATDDIGCSRDTLFTIEHLHNNPKISVDILDSAACNTATNGSIEISATQPIATDDLTFYLGSAPKTDPASVTFTGLGVRTATSMYQIRVADTMGCESDTSITFSAITHPVKIVNYASIDASCIRAANAGYHAEVFGGMPGDAGIYFVLNSTDTLVGNQVDFNGYSVTGNNTIRVYDSYGCYNEIGPFWFTVREDSLNISVLSSTDASCPGYADGNIDVEALNGNPYPQGFYYRVIDQSTQHTINEEYGNSTHILSGLPIGQYYIEVTDEDNCLATSTDLDISEPIAPELLVSPGYVAQKGDNTGWIDAKITDGNGRYNIEWYTGENIVPANLISGETTTGLVSLPGLTAGTYSLRIQDTAKCIFWDDAWFEETVNVPEPDDSLKLHLAELIPVSCNGLSDGQFTFEGTGGWGNTYFYGNDIGNINLSSPVFSNLPEGEDYIFYVRDTSGVVASASFDMTEPEVLSTTVNNISDAQCFGNNDGEVHLDITGGNETYYVSADETEWQEGNILNGLIAGNYTVYVRDNLDCSTSVMATVNQPDDIIVTDTSITNTKCQVNEGIIDASVAGGIPTYNYQWYNNGQLLEEGSSYIDSLLSGVYNLQVTDAHDCQKDFIFHISDLTDLEIQSISTEPVSCWEGNDGSAEVSIINGNPPYLIIWPDSSNQNSVNGLEAGTHLLSIYDIEGCKVFENFEIGSPDSIWVEIQNLYMPLCLGVADGNIDLEARGGTPDYNYLWNTGRRNNSVSGLDAGTYTVQVTDANDCIRDFTFETSYQEEITTQLPGDITICHNNSYPLDPGEFAFYLWSRENEFLSSDRVLNAEEAGSYVAELEDSRGCQTSDTVIISTSSTDLGAQMLMASVIHVNDTVVIFEASVPVPDSINLYMDESLQVIESGQYYRYVVATDTGTFDVTLVSYLNDCQDIITKTMYVLPDNGQDDDFYAMNQSLIKHVELFPNPSTTGDFSVEIKLYDKADVQLRMVSFGDGATVDMRKLYNSDYFIESFNRQDLPPGTYLLSVQAGEEMQNIKIIIL